MLILAEGVGPALRAAAADALPDEACGLAFAEPAAPDRIVRVRPLPNRSPAPAARFECDPGEVVAALTRARAEGLVHRVIFHSHPRPGPGLAPSEEDRRAALLGGGPAWPGIAHLLIGRSTDARWRLSSWRLDALGRWEEIRVEET